MRENKSKTSKNKVKNSSYLRRIASLLFIIASCIMITGCSSSRVAKKEGGVCEIELENIPKEFSKINDTVMKNFRITVKLENILTEKSYEVKLTNKDDFKTQITLKPGKYRIVRCINNLESDPELDIQARQETVTVTKGDVVNVEVYINNKKQVKKWIKIMQPTEKILEADQFSGLVQYKGKVITARDIVKHEEFKKGIDVEPYKKYTLWNFDRGIKVIVLNDTSQYLNYEECQVLSVTFKKANAILPGGVMWGLEFKEISHASEGIYGTPTRLVGSMIYGSYLDLTNLEYVDEETGNKIVIEWNDTLKVVGSLTYTFNIVD